MLLDVTIREHAMATSMPLKEHFYQVMSPAAFLIFLGKTSTFIPDIDGVSQNIFQLKQNLSAPRF